MHGPVQTRNSLGAMQHALQHWLISSVSGFGDGIEAFDHKVILRLLTLTMIQFIGASSRIGDYKGTLVWYDKWVERVRAHCKEQPDLHR